MPQDFIPKLVDHIVGGRFPIEKMITFYDLADINRAAQEFERRKNHQAGSKNAELGGLRLLGDSRELPQDRGGAFKPLLRPFPFVEKHQLLVPRVLRIAAHAHTRSLLADEDDQAFRIGEDIVAERQHDTLRSGLDLFDIGAAAERLDRHDLQEMLDLFGQRTEAVDQFGGESFDVPFVFDFGQPPVEREPHREIGDVILRNQNRRADGDLRRPAVGDRRGDTGFQAQNRLFQHLLIELETDFLDVAGLLLAEQIAGAANIEVVRGELESGAERVQRLQNFQPPFGLRRDGAAAGSVNNAKARSFERPTRPRN